MNIKKIVPHLAAMSILILPLVARAHGGVDDGDAQVEANGHHVGASALMKAFSPLWFGLLVTFGSITIVLSYIVYQYIQVTETKKPDAKKPDVPAQK